MRSSARCVTATLALLLLVTGLVPLGAVALLVPDIDTVQLIVLVAVTAAVAVGAGLILGRAVTAPLARILDTAQQLGLLESQGPQPATAADLAARLHELAAEDAQRQAMLETHARLASAAQLGAGVVHEVKNPLTAIIGFAQVARARDELPPRTDELLGQIEQQGLRCKAILNDYLRFARGSRGTIESVDLNSLVRDTERLLQHQLSMKRSTIDLDLAEDLPLVAGDPRRLQQVLVNLGLNASEAMTDGGVVRFTTSILEDREVSVTVSDEGPGISDAVALRLFQPFFTTKGDAGNGLGLYVSRGIVQAHGGDLRVVSQSARGAAFEMRLRACSDL